MGKIVTMERKTVDSLAAGGLLAASVESTMDEAVGETEGIMTGKVQPFLFAGGIAELDAIPLFKGGLREGSGKSASQEAVPVVEDGVPVLATS